MTKSEVFSTRYATRVTNKRGRVNVEETVGNGWYHPRVPITQESLRESRLEIPNCHTGKHQAENSTEGELPTGEKATIYGWSRFRRGNLLNA